MTITPHTIIVTVAALVLLAASVTGHSAQRVDGCDPPVPVDGNSVLAASLPTFVVTPVQR